MNETNSTSDYRAYAKGPKFGFIVAGAAVFLLLALIAVVMFLHRDAAKLVPHRPNPTPNSLVRPLAQPAETLVA